MKWCVTYAKLFDYYYVNGTYHRVYKMSRVFERRAVKAHRATLQLALSLLHDDDDDDDDDRTDAFQIRVRPFIVVVVVVRGLFSALAHTNSLSHSANSHESHQHGNAQ